MGADLVQLMDSSCPSISSSHCFYRLLASEDLVGLKRSDRSWSKERNGALAGGKSGVQRFSFLKKRDLAADFMLMGITQ